MGGVPSKTELECDEPEPDSDPDVSRDTVRPAFDVELYAEQVTGRERLSTILDEEATEEARVASLLMDSEPPPLGATAETAVSVAYADLDALAADEQIAFYRAKLSPLSRVPVLTRSITELGHLIEDPKTAYVLGFVDGLLPLEMIVDVAGLPELDVLRVLDRAIEQVIVTFPDDEPG